MAAVTLVALPSALGRSPTYVTYDCQHVKERPHSILFACGDGNFYVNHLRWFSWHRKKAFARGVYHYNDCDPNCAEGKFHRIRGSLKLEFRRWCADQKKFVFKHAYTHYRRPHRGHSRESFGLQCPF